MNSWVSVFCLGTGAPFLGGCGSGPVEELCDTAVICELIEEGEGGRCVEDLEAAIEEGSIERRDVRRCRRCVNGVGCGLNVIVGCSEECEEVGPYVTGSAK